MIDSYWLQPLLFLIQVIFGFYMGVVALRIIMQWAQWDYYHPLVQFIIRLTQHPVKSLRQFIPPIGRWDTATFVLLFLLAILKFILIGLLLPELLHPVILLRLALAALFSLFITLFSASILIQAVLSWIQPHGNTLAPLLYRMNNPLLRPIRRIIPDLGGLDLSPLIALIGLQLLSMLILPLLTGPYTLLF